VKAMSPCPSLLLDDLKAPDNLFLAPLKAQQMQQTQQIIKKMRTAAMIPMTDPTDPPMLFPLPVS